MKDGRRHTCPVCQKVWPCMAATPPRDKHYHLKRPVWECAYPDTLQCLQCAQEGRPSKRSSA